MQLGKRTLGVFGLMRRWGAKGAWLFLLVFFAQRVYGEMAPVEAPPKADLTRGQQISQTVCAACHNVDGNSSIPANPKLAGLSAKYLAKQLESFRRVPGKVAERPNAVMAGIVGGLSASDVRDVSAYFSSQKFKSSIAKRPDLVSLGQKIYRGGVLERGVPACAGCHGPSGAGIPDQYPRLKGQFAEYVSAQLLAFRSGSRAGPMMPGVAERLSDAEIQAVSDYIAGLR